ncbi:probable serine/threonine-protein kinase PBL15 [Tripterygium wilfordii]|uniref:probable serine/threonine-protein kinase PBL15 n=1 Tax=Tripterygium wilfordii TaxID=458696 RepID=UPI0018F800CE|nr:probable serine/threonine-protein kinase PBL15 [Tripterygium wilfordii]
MSKYATIAGGAAGLLAFVAMVIGVVWFCKSQCKNLSNRNSETGSSDPSALVEWNGGAGPSSAPDQSTLGPPEARQFTMEELEQATKQFSEINLIGFGSFGSVYKGLLSDTVVAIKRRPGAPRQEFVAEVLYLSEIRHRNLVTLLGYCQDSGSQMLVFEYLPNGSICNHLYDTGQESSTKLEFKQRLSIALGAAKGLCHLHALSPPLVHKNFKTANVLVDENFIAKVADAGISKILEKIEEAGPSHMSRANAFDDPEVGISGTFTEVSDAYSFGVFLLELITGQRATHIDSLGSEESFIQWVRLQLTSNNFVDYRLHGSFTVNGIRDLIRLTIQCMSFLGRGRPVMEMVVQELERIHEKEMALTTVMGECTTTITLGSELFT